MIYQLHWQKIKNADRTHFVAQSGDLNTPEECRTWLRDVMARRRDECPDDCNALVVNQDAPQFVRAA